MVVEMGGWDVIWRGREWGFKEPDARVSFVFLAAALVVLDLVTIEQNRGHTRVYYQTNEKHYAQIVK